MTITRKAGILLVAVFVLLALAFTGCSADDDDDKDPVKEPKTWTLVQPGVTGTGGFTGVAYGKNTFVAVTNTKEIFWSADGQTWQKEESGYTDMGNTANYVYFFNDRFLLVDRGATGANAGDNKGHWATSSDGKTWNDVVDAPVQNTAATGGGVYANGKAIVGSNGSNIYVSDDFLNWNAKATGLSRTNPETSVVTNINWINSVAYGKGKYVIGGGGGLIGYSGDLETWTNISWTTGSDLFGTGNNDYINQIVFSADKGLFLAIGGPSGGQCIAATSPDGITWTQIDDIKITTNDNRIFVGYGAGVFITAFGSAASYTTDAYHWTLIADTKFGTSTINAIGYGAGKFVMVGGDGKIAYSIPE
ncbi:MAG: hypothetical protein LBK63_09250 [Treponema sp.]|jgi:hypothetical protein|nr:hypothetical protein [Treponema sp.]